MQNRGSQKWGACTVICRRNPPDLILLDVIMPGMTGFEVCNELKNDSDTRDIPVIFITALENAEEKTKGFKAGGVDYIVDLFTWTRSGQGQGLILRSGICR